MSALVKDRDGLGGAEPRASLDDFGLVHRDLEAESEAPESSRGAGTLDLEVVELRLGD